MIVFVSSFISPHTQPLCLSLIKQGESVCFVSLAPLSDERKALGYEKSSEFVNVVEYYKDSRSCADLILNADVVLFSHYKINLLNERCKAGKLTFIYSERLLKKGILKFLDIRLYKQWLFHLRYRRKNLFLLSIGKNSAYDFKLLGFNSKKIFRCGYFPEIIIHDKCELLRNNKTIELIWVGRFVGFKRLPVALKAVRRLCEQGENIHMTVIGDGAGADKVKKYVEKKGLPITLTGTLPQHAVREKMLQSDIMLCTSSRGEGWGAVINEAMNSGCCVICSEAAGAAETLLQDGKNGFLYSTENELAEKLTYAIHNEAWRRKAGFCAYKTVTEIWNADVASEELLQLSQELQSGLPLSRKKVLKPIEWGKV